MIPQDDLLVQRCLGGEKDAFGVLVDKYKDAVYGLAYSKVHNFHDAQDISQEAFIDAYMNLRSLKYPHRFSSWIYTIVANRCRMWLRKQPREPLAFAFGEQPGLEANMHDQAVHRRREEQILDSVLDAINELPKATRLVMTLYYIDGLTCKEIGEFTGTSINTVMSKLRRAREKLRKEFTEMPAQTMTQQRVPSGFTTGVLRAIEHISPTPQSPPNSISRIIRIPWAVGLIIGLAIIGVLYIDPPGELHDTGGNEGLVAVYSILDDGSDLPLSQHAEDPGIVPVSPSPGRRMRRGVASGSGTAVEDDQIGGLQCRLSPGDLLTYRVRVEEEDTRFSMGSLSSAVDGTHLLLVMDASQDGVMRIVSVTQETKHTTATRTLTTSRRLVAPRQAEKSSAAMGLMYVGQTGRREVRKEREEIVDSLLRVGTGIPTVGIPEDPYFVPFPSAPLEQGDTYTWKTTRIIQGPNSVVTSDYTVTAFKKVKGYDCVILDREQVFVREGPWSTGDPPEHQRVEAVKARIACDMQSGIVVEFGSQTMARHDPESGGELSLDFSKHVAAELIQRHQLDHEALAAEKQVLEQIESALAEHRGVDKLDDLRQRLEQIKEEYHSTLLMPGLVGMIADVEQRIANARFCSPNPFKPNSGNNVTFDPSARRIVIHDYEGQIVRKLSGNKWDGRDEEGQAVASGVYFYKAEVDGDSRIGKLTVIY